MRWRRARSDAHGESRWKCIRWSTRSYEALLVCFLGASDASWIFQMVWVNVNKGKLRMHTYRHSLVRQSVHLQYVVDKSEHCFATIAIGSVSGPSSVPEPPGILRETYKRLYPSSCRDAELCPATSPALHPCRWTVAHLLNGDWLFCFVLHALPYFGISLLTL